MQVAAKLSILEQRRKQEEMFHKVGVWVILMYILMQLNFDIWSIWNIIMWKRYMEIIILQMLEEEEVRLLRKEMIPKAQLMPFFDRPFIPQR